MLAGYLHSSWSKLGKRHVNVHASTPTRVVHSLPMQAVGYTSQ